jgi:hypothetical protein
MYTARELCHQLAGIPRYQSATPRIVGFGASSDHHTVGACRWLSEVVAGGLHLKVRQEVDSAGSRPKLQHCQALAMGAERPVIEPQAGADELAQLHTPAALPAYPRVRAPRTPLYWLSSGPASSGWDGRWIRLAGLITVSFATDIAAYTNMLYAWRMDHRC